MAKVTKTVAETTYDITGLTTRQAAVIDALLAQMGATPWMQSVYDALRGALQGDPRWERREVVMHEPGNFCSPLMRISGYITRVRD